VPSVGLYHELRWRRRSGWLYSLICLLVAGGLGVVVSSFMTPLVLLAVGLPLKLAARIGISPLVAAGGSAVIRDWAHYQLTNFGQVLDATQKIHSLGGLTFMLPALERLSTVAVPALAVGILVWFWLRALNLRVGGADLVETLSARPPRPDDQTELRLANSLETSAIASGVPAPRLFLIDQTIVNAAAIGTSPKNSAVLVSRGLIDALSTAETEAAMGRLVAMICAGDLAVAQSVNAAFQTFGLFLTLLDLPVRWGAWRTLGGLMLVGITPRPSPRSVARTAARLDDSLQADTIVDVNKLIAKFPVRLLGVIVTAPFLPFIVISALFKTVMFLWSAFFMGPPLWMMWHNRCLWTDTTAARRNLDPDDLASALEKMTDVPEGAESRAYLFLGARETKRRAVADRRTVTMALAPSVYSRRQRLLAMDANSIEADHRRKPGRFGFVVFIVVLLTLLLLLGLILFALIGYLTLIVMTIALAAGLALVVALV
jgi:Zn-dependent protease with chaperone function